MKKENLKFHLKVAIVTYSILYLCISFIGWDILKPIKLIMDLHSYSSDDRFLILFVGAIVNPIIHAVAFGNLSSDNKLKTNK